MKIQTEQTNLEDLIILGAEKKVNIIIEFPVDDRKVEASAKIKPLTLEELDDLNINEQDYLKMQMEVLKNNLFKNNGETYSEEELKAFPIGIINKIVQKIMEISGIDYDAQKLRDF